MWMSNIVYPVPTVSPLMSQASPSQWSICLAHAALALNQTINSFSGKHWVQIIYSICSHGIWLDLQTKHK